ncbi:FKBP-type peptidyl-prolyl cis-trans isomerase [Sphingomonas sp.]|uniref:FKBP-type peptidyl-prolyl cis-trans isomerase n=1 Tax=Sphingomonas sp. TaxID=28214 RepID=UPI003B39FCB6
MSDITAVPLRPVGKSGVTALWAGIALLLIGGIGGGVYATTAARQGAVASPAMAKLPAPAFMAANGKRHGVKTTASGLEYMVIKAGSGPTPTPADVALVDYRGALTDGTEFDASKPGQPVPMPLSRVVPGFREALSLMPKDSVYRFWIPPEQAYGSDAKSDATGNVVIPANSVLVFDVTMHQFVTMPPGMAEPGM